MTPIPPPSPSLGLTGPIAWNIRDRYYKNQTIPLDGYTFTNCCFHNCNLETDTGVFALRACTIANCQIRYGPNALRILKLFNIFNPSWKMFPKLLPNIGADGAVTIE